MANQKEIDRGDFLEEDIEELDDIEKDEEELEEEVEDSDDDVESDEEEELEEDSEEEEEEDLEEEEEETEEEEKEENRIPISRLNQVLAQRDQEKERVAWLEAQLEKLIEQGTLPSKDEEIDEPFDFVAAEAKYIELILEGETKEAAELRTIIDEERQEQLQREIEAAKETAKEEAKSISREELEEEKFQLTVESFENKYPFLDSDSDQYNQEAVETTNMLMIGYLQNGMTKSQALKKAVEKVAPMFHTEQKQTTSDKATKRKKQARKKNIETMKKSPPKTRGKGSKEIDIDSIDISKMSEKDFNKLSAKEKAILRGDTF